MARPAHRPSRRSHILDAALTLFVEQGANAVTVAEIAERAGMTPAAVYYHFPSKAEVLLELVGEIGDRLTDLFDDDGTDAGIEPWLAARYDALDAWRRDSPGELELYLTASVGFSTAVESIRRRNHRELLAGTADVVARSRPELDAVEVQIVALGLVTLLLEAFSTATPAGRAEVVAIGAQLRDASTSTSSRSSSRPRPRIPRLRRH